VNSAGISVAPLNAEPLVKNPVKQLTAELRTWVYPRDPPSNLNRILANNLSSDSGGGGDGGGDGDGGDGATEVSCTSRRKLAFVGGYNLFDSINCRKN